MLPLSNSFSLKKSSFFIFIAIGFILFAGACKKNFVEKNASFENRENVKAVDYPILRPVAVINYDINANTTWTADSTYEIRGIVTVTNNATLTIKPGVYIKNGTPIGNTQNGVLVIARDGTLNAIGKKDSVIVFTSRAQLDTNNSTHGSPGDFGGVIVLGEATVNVANKLIEGLPDLPKFHYGGSNDADNSGTLKYVRIEFGGFKLAENVEVNGLTLGGVGTGTTLDYIQVTLGLDDGFEFFGGTVNASHLIALANDDDQFDFDNGYRGTITWGWGLIDAYSSHSTSGGASDANGIELDNNAPAEKDSFNLIPKTHPVLRHFSIIGVKNSTLIPPITNQGLKWGARIRRGGEITIDSSIITGFKSGLIFDVATNASLSNGKDVSAGAQTGAFPDYGNATAVLGTGSITATNFPNLVTLVANPSSLFNLIKPWYNENTPSTLIPNNHVTAGLRGAFPSPYSFPTWADTWAKYYGW